MRCEVWAQPIFSAAEVLAANGTGARAVGREVYLKLSNGDGLLYTPEGLGLLESDGLGWLAAITAHAAMRLGCLRLLGVTTMNVPPDLLLRKTLAQAIGVAFGRGGVTAEITEQADLGASHAHRRAAQDLAGMGVPLALDDYQTTRPSRLPILARDLGRPMIKLDAEALGNMEAVVCLADLAARYTAPVVLERVDRAQAQFVMERLPLEGASRIWAQGNSWGRSVPLSINFEVQS